MTDLNDCLSKEVIRLPCELLPEPGLEVIVLVPDPDLDPVAGVVALAEKIAFQQFSEIYSDFRPTSRGRRR
jgi:hypothetical protein